MHRVSLGKLEDQLTADKLDRISTSQGIREDRILLSGLVALQEGLENFTAQYVGKGHSSIIDLGFFEFKA